jgi:peptide/nickel transport system permease protein
MTAFILRRIVQLVPVLIGVTILAFLLVNLLPGNMALAMLGPDASAEAVAHLSEQLGLNQPIWLRYLHWLGNALTGNLGWSVVQAQAVAPAMLQRFPVTVEIILLGQLIGVVIAVPSAVAVAMQPNGWLDRALGLLAYSAIATPRFLFGLLLILAFAVYWRIFPSTGFQPIDEGLAGNLRSVALPAFTIGALEYAVYFRVLRGEMLRNLTEDYVLAARAKGLSRLEAVLRHVLRNSIVALVTIIGLGFGPLVSGAVIVESLFSLPGVGDLLVTSIYQRDAVMVQGVVVVVATTVVLVNLGVDVVHLLLDPRIRIDVG